jgi:cold shock protein
MHTGTVQFFNELKGFGFIKDAYSSQPIFVHVTALIDDIHEDDEVVYEIREGKKGVTAVNVRRA